MSRPLSDRGQDSSIDGYIRFHDDSGVTRPLSAPTGQSEFRPLSFILVNRLGPNGPERRMAPPGFCFYGAVSFAGAASRLSNDDTEFDEILQQELVTNDVELSGLNSQHENHSYWEMNYHEAAIFLEASI